MRLGGMICRDKQRGDFFCLAPYRRSDDAVQNRKCHRLPMTQLAEKERLRKEGGKYRNNIRQTASWRGIPCCFDASKLRHVATRSGLPLFRHGLPVPCIAGSAAAQSFRQTTSRNLERGEMLVRVFVKKGYCRWQN